MLFSPPSTICLSAEGKERDVRGQVLVRYKRGEVCGGQNGLEKQESMLRRHVQRKGGAGTVGSPGQGTWPQGGDLSSPGWDSRARAVFRWASLPQLRLLASLAKILAFLWLEDRVRVSREGRASQKSHQEEVNQQITK